MNEVLRINQLANQAKKYESLTVTLAVDDVLSAMEQLTATTNSLTNAQEALKSAGIEADTVQAGVMELVSRMNQVVAENKVLDGALGAIADAYETGMADLLAKEIDTAVNIETPSTDAYLNAVRADTERMNYLAGKVVNVRTPLPYGSHNIFWSQCITDDSDPSYETDLREQIDAQLRAGNAGKDGSHDTTDKAG